MTVLDKRPVYCRKCARLAAWAGHSLDPRYPWVLCTWRTPDGKVHGHGRTVGTFDQAEAQGLVLERQERTRARNHAALRHRDHPVRECKDCQREAGHPRHRALRMFVSDCAECLESMERTGSATAHMLPSPR